MAVYKVPQDVEAEDKLIGPFGFRQFIYLIIVAFAGFVAYILSQIFIGLVLIPLPFMIFFAAIALPLRKDQPTETYLAAILQYNLKPKKRMWMPDGVLATVEITAPKLIEESRVKDITQEEAAERIERLSQIMDTQGWASRGVFNPNVDSTSNVNLAENVVAEAEGAKDILDENSFNKLIDEQKVQSKEQAKKRMEAAVNEEPTPVVAAQESPVEAGENFKSDEEILKGLQYNPYPTSIHQAVIQPMSQKSKADSAKIQPEQSPKSTSDNTPSPDIINLVDNDLKISTIAQQVKRAKDKQVEEVDIKLH